MMSIQQIFLDMFDGLLKAFISSHGRPPSLERRRKGSLFFKPLGHGWKVDIELDRPFPFSVDGFRVKPDRTRQQADILREVVIKAEASTSNGIISRGVVGGKNKLVVLLAFACLAT